MLLPRRIRHGRRTITHIPPSIIRPTSSIRIGVSRPLVSPGGATAKQDDKHGKEQDDRRGEYHPNGIGIARVSDVGIVVDLSFDDSKHDKVDDERCEGDQEGEEGQEGGEDEPESVGKDGHEEG